MIFKPDDSKAMQYVKTLDDTAKRHYAIGYLAWIRAGRVGVAPKTEPLSILTARVVSRKLDTLN